MIDSAKEGLCSTFVEYIDGVRHYLETEADKESEPLQQIRLHFTDFVRHLIRNTPGAVPEQKPKIFAHYGPCKTVSWCFHIKGVVPDM